ncbi:hypothetical protein Ancab_018600 [Ancistrocladus abbreviatus]
MFICSAVKPLVPFPYAIAMCAEVPPQSSPRPSPPPRLVHPFRFQLCGCTHGGSAGAGGCAGEEATGTGGNACASNGDETGAAFGTGNRGLHGVGTDGLVAGETFGDGAAVGVDATGGGVSVLGAVEGGIGVAGSELVGDIAGACAFAIATRADTGQNSRPPS